MQCRGRMRVFPGTFSESTGRGESTETIWCCRVVYPGQKFDNSLRWIFHAKVPWSVQSHTSWAEETAAEFGTLHSLCTVTPWNACSQPLPAGIGSLEGQDTDPCPIPLGWVWWAAFLHGRAKEKLLSTALHLRSWLLCTGPKWDLKSYPRYWCWISEMLCKF